MNLRIRAVQLDVARQPETIEFIKQFCRFIADNGFNTLMLYIEGRIRTQSFPYPAENESYSVDEMKELVAYAERLGIDVIPVVSTLGHAEKFLKYMPSLSELRNGDDGRFFKSRGKQVFCPSLPETYEFLEAYLQELADIFTSEYFHVGCDESWDIGICDLCRKRIEDGENQSDIFAKHIISSYKIITEKIGKRMLMWDDMFEQYPNALAILPKDIVMCTWNYSVSPDIPVGHFNNGKRNDPFAYYSSNGFDYIFSTVSTIPNVELFTGYADKYEPLGGLITIWELQNSFMYRRFPAIAFIGKWWATGEKCEFSDIINEIFSITDDEFVNAIKAVSSGMGLAVKRSISDYRCGCSEYGNDICEQYSIIMLWNILSRYMDKVDSELGRSILEDICTTLEQIIVHNEIEEDIKSFELNFAGNKLLEQKLVPQINKIEMLEKKRTEQWQRWRTNIAPCNINSYYAKIKEDISQIIKSDIGEGFLQLYFFLPDQYGAPVYCVSVKYQDSDCFETVAEGYFKASDVKTTYYSTKIRVSSNRIPVSVKIDVYGYGGQGITYMTIKNRMGHYIPLSIEKSYGEVVYPEFILEYDRKWCYLGTQDIQQAVVNCNIADKKHGVIVNMGSK